MDDRAWRVLRRHPGAWIGAFLLAGILLFSLVAPIVSPYRPDAQNDDDIHKPPSWEHWMGTDGMGRDVLTRLAQGGRLSLRIGVITVLLGGAIGVLLGGASGYFGGRVDRVLSRVVDYLMSFPRVLLAITLAVAMGRGELTVEIAVAVVTIPQFARQVRGAVLVIREMEFVTACRAMGAGDGRILLRHVLPNAMGPILVIATLGLGTAILDTAALSFLGLGVETGTPEWGAMLREARDEFRYTPYPAVFSGLAVSLAVLAFNLLGDALRDAADPRLRTR